MKKTYRVTRRVVIPTDDNFKPVTFEHSLEVSYNDQEMEEMTVIDSQEFKELSDIVDKVQRKEIKERMGITKLPMDKDEDGIKKPHLKWKGKK